MTSLRRSYMILIGATIVAVCAFGQSIEHWNDPRAWFGVIGVAAGALVNGFAKSPRDAAITDAATGEVVATSTVTNIDTKTVTKLAGETPLSTGGT